MTTDADCVFCKILNGEIPSFKIFEDENTYAFMDINPAHPGHALVIPKEHGADLYATSADAVGATMLTAQRVARAVQATVRPQGLNLIQCNGEAAGQSVFHFHMHVLPRQSGDELKMNWGLSPGDMDAIGALAEKIKSNIAI